MQTVPGPGTHRAHRPLRLGHFWACSCAGTWPARPNTWPG